LLIATTTASHAHAQGPAIPPAPHTAAAPARQPASAIPQATAASSRDNQQWLRIAQQANAPTSQADPSATATAAAASPPAPSPANERAERQAAALQLVASNRDATQSRHEELTKENADWDAKLKQVTAGGLPDPRPYSFLALDKARDELAAEKLNATALDESTANAKNLVTQATTDSETRERELRRAKEVLQNNTDPAAAAALATAVADAEHESTLASQTLELRRAELANVQLERQVQSLRQAYPEQKVELLESDAVFTQSMLDEVLTELDARGRAASNDVKQLGDDLNKYLQPQWYNARERLDAARVSQDPATLAALEAEVRAKDLAQQGAQYKSGTLVTKLDRLKDLETTWRRRFALENGPISSADAAQWVQETKAAASRLRSDAGALNAKLDSIRRQLESLEKRRQNADLPSAVGRWLTVSSQLLEEQRRLCERGLTEMDAARLVHQKLLDDLTSGTISDTAGRWLAEIWQNLQHVWNYELANVQDRSITVGRVVTGLLLFLIGIYASRLISRAFGRRLLSRMGINAGASAALQSIAFYLLVLVFTLSALRLVEVPLTAFTVLGGALALGVGFGSQNIVNNFISGLILLAERPVKVGDLIQIADVYGNVEHIGARSTRVKTGENLDIIVPNSAFLETNVINWTLSDNHMRTKVIFGVVYGSSLGKVTQLALKAAASHDRVFDRPAPFVIFADFGDNALVFELHFWVAVRTLMERRTIESELRYKIDQLYREAGIVIAFPQRDVHLFTQQPIRIQMAPPAEQSASDAA